RAGGARLLARPGDLVAAGPAGAIGERCPEQPTGLVYVAYPECHLVAAVDAGTGEVQAGIQFGAGGAVSLTGPGVTCPVQCGDEALADPIAADPIGRPTNVL